MVSTVRTAKSQTIPLIQEDINKYNLPNIMNTKIIDEDPGKFLLFDKPARIIHKRDGFYAKINLDWFNGNFSLPKINRKEFFWYVFALASAQSKEATTYFICDYLSMINFVLDFDSPKGKNHQNHPFWNGRISILDESQNKGYFRWQDEDKEINPNRYINLRNIQDIFNSLESRIIDHEPLNDIEIHKHSFQNENETVRMAIIQSRIGQGDFREQLIDYWGGCSITGLKNLEVLIASHIKPWSKSTNNERLDVFNGLLLTPNLDKLFDKGFITFNNDGIIIISKVVNKQDYDILGINSTMKLRHVSENHKNFLSYHRQNIFQIN